MQIKDLYRSVTDAIVAELEAGAVPWLRPWKGTNLMPANAVTKKRYNGINIPILWYIAGKRGYEHHLWCTYRQALEIGAQVRKGEQAAHIVYTSTYTKIVEDEGATARFLKSYSVFNIAQLDDYPMPEPPTATQIERNAHADQVITATGAVIHYGGNDACYIPSQDVINIPKPDAFPTAAPFYATCFLTSGTGQPAKSASTVISKGASAPESMPPRNWWRNCAARSCVRRLASRASCGTPGTSTTGYSS